MNFGKIIVHEKLELLVASHCTQFIENRKRKSFGGVVFWQAADL